MEVGRTIIIINSDANTECQRERDVIYYYRTGVSVMPIVCNITLRFRYSNRLLLLFPNTCIKFVCVRRITLLQCNEGGL